MIEDADVRFVVCPSLSIGCWTGLQMYTIIVFPSLTFKSMLFVDCFNFKWIFFTFLGQNQVVLLEFSLFGLLSWEQLQPIFCDSASLVNVNNYNWHKEHILVRDRFNIKQEKISINMACVGVRMPTKLSLDIDAPR